MTASYDFKINFILTANSLLSALILSNRNRDYHKENITSCVDVRNFKLDFHKHYTDYIFRYRALLDKYMGLIVMEFKPLEYEKFVYSNSRKKSYRKFCENNAFNEEYINKFNEILSEFDNKLRTPEAHATGRIRKYTLTEDYNTDELSIVSLSAWNMLVGLLAFNKLNIGNEERFIIKRTNWNV